MNKDKQHQKMVKNSKRLGYAGLATITLVSGMGVTPVILADENFAKTLEAPATLFDSVSTNENNNKKLKQPRATAYQLKATDFTVNGTVLTGFTDAFLNSSNFTNWDGAFSIPTELQGITAIDYYAFQKMPSITSIDLSNLPALTEVGAFAFSFCPNITTMTLYNLPVLRNFSTMAFYGASALRKVFIGGTPKFTIEPSALTGIPQGGEIILLEFNGTKDIDGAAFFGYMLNSFNGNGFSNRARAWFIRAQVQYNFIGPEGEIVAPPIIDNTGYTGAEIRIGDVRNGFGITAAPNSPYAVRSAESLVGTFANYDNPTVKDGSNTGTILQLVQNITYTYDWAAAADFTIRYADIHGNPITNPNTDSGVIDDITVSDHYAKDEFTLPQETELEDPDLANYVFKEIRRSTDDGSWETISLDDLPATYGENDGHNYQFIYSEIDSVTQMYLDEAGKMIPVDGNHRTLKGIEGTTYDYTFAADTDEYYANGAPKIAGYDEPIVTEESDATAGEIDDTRQKVVIYQYKTIAQPVTIYRVDANGVQLAEPEQVSGHITDSLDLGDKQQSFAGYDFDHLEVGTVKAKALTDFDWKASPELVGKAVNLGDNNGRSFKFVYTPVKDTTKPDDTDKTPDDTDKTPDKPVTNDKPGKLPVTGGNDNTPGKKPAKTPKPGNKTPAKLPSSGGNQNSNKTTNTANVVNVTQTTNSKRNLPKSGNARSYLLPAVGATILAGIIGLSIFKKKYKL